MHRTSRQRLSTLLSPALVLTMTMALLAAGSAGAGASSPAAVAGAVKPSVRTISRGLTLTFPTNQRVGTVHGIQSPEVRPSDEPAGEGIAAP